MTGFELGQGSKTQARSSFSVTAVVSYGTGWARAKLQQKNLVVNISPFDLQTCFFFFFILHNISNI